jgi:hypothetical protein
MIDFLRRQNLPDRIVPFILVLQIVSILFFWAFFQDHAPIIAPDSKGYIEFSWSEMFDHVRTIGYPAFVHSIRCFDPTLRFLPTLQLMIHLGAVLAFAASCRRFGFSKLMTLAISSPLLYSPAIRDTRSWVLTDALGCSVSILVIGCLLIALHSPPSWRWWLVLGAILFVNYTIRPAYLFMVGLVPFLAIAIALIRYGIHDWRKQVKQSLLRAVCVSVLPLMLFCTLRLVLTNHFGLVSFGGYNMIGIMSQFVGREDIALVPAEFKPVTTFIVEEQRNRRLININENGQRVLSYREIMANYNVYIHQLIVPFLAEQGLTKPSEIDRFLNRYVGVLLGLHGDAYLQWLKYSVTFALSRAPDPMFNLALVLVLIGLYLARIAMPLPVSRGSYSIGRWEPAVVLIFGFGFLLAKLVLVVAVELPIDRYLLPVYLFLPSMLIAGIVSNLNALKMVLHPQHASHEGN